MARVDIIMPQMGESIAEGTLSKWLKKVGDEVKRDEPIFEISTDKVDAEIPAPAAGVLAEIIVKEGAGCIRCRNTGYFGRTGIFEILFDPTFLATMAAAIFAFATIVTLGLPLADRDQLGQRLKAVSERREELRAQHHAALNAKGGSLRSEPVGYMKMTLDRFNLGNLLESEDTRDKLARAGYRGQGPVVTFMFFRFVVPFVVLLLTMVYLFAISSVAWSSFMKINASVGAALLGFLGLALALLLVNVVGVAAAILPFLTLTISYSFLVSAHFALPKNPAREA